MRQGTCVIVNRNAGSYDGDRRIAEYAAVRPHTEVRFSEEAGHARELAARALEEGFARVVAAGGDGTINEVVAGLLPDADGVILGVLPLGTGNDLARSLGIPLDLGRALRVLDTGDVRPLDAIRIEPEGEALRFGINACVGGVACELTEELDQEVKRVWGVLAFVGAGLRMALELEPFDVEITWEGSERERRRLVGAVVANGRTAGGGQQTAPRASLEDGWLDVVTVDEGSAAQLAQIAAGLLAGDYTRSPLVRSRRARSVRFAATPPMWFNVDGELLTRAPVRFEVVPAALRGIVGPGYAAAG